MKWMINILYTCSSKRWRNVINWVVIYCLRCGKNIVPNVITYSSQISNTQTVCDNQLSMKYKIIDKEIVIERPDLWNFKRQSETIFHYRHGASYWLKDDMPVFLIRCKNVSWRLLYCDFCASLVSAAVLE